MLDEYNKPVAEFNSQKENVNITENKPVLENKVVDENVPVKETLDTRSSEKPTNKMNQKKKEHALSTLSAGVVGAVGIAAFGITSMINVKMSANFNNVEFIDSSLVLSVDVKEMTSENTLTAYVYEESKQIRIISLEDEDNDGKIEYKVELDKDHLNEVLGGDGEHEIKYRVDLKGIVGLNVERSFDSYVVRVNHVCSKFNSLYGQCHCKADGRYHFYIDYEDDFGLIEFTSARIEDKFGNVSKCTFTTNLHDEQTIYVLDLQGSKGTLIVEYTMNGVPQDPQMLDIEF